VCGVRLRGSDTPATLHTVLVGRVRLRRRPNGCWMYFLHYRSVVRTEGAADGLSFRVALTVRDIVRSNVNGASIMCDGRGFSPIGASRHA
jgi:hypothetical protein